MGGLNKREHFIKVGQEVIWNKGYHLSSIKDIAQAAGLPKGSFYHYFESKEAFALEAMNDFINTSKESLQSEPADVSTFEALIDKRIESIIKINFSKECYMSVMCHAYTDQGEAFRKAIVTAIDTSNEAVYEILSQLKKQKLIDESLDLSELHEYIDFTWRGARLKARMLKSDQPLRLFKKYLFAKILPPKI